MIQSTAHFVADDQAHMQVSGVSNYKGLNGVSTDKIDIDCNTLYTVANSQPQLQTDMKLLSISKILTAVKVRTILIYVIKTADTCHLQQTQS